jgi:hypothetical protein
MTCSSQNAFPILSGIIIPCSDKKKEEKRRADVLVLSQIPSNSVTFVASSRDVNQLMVTISVTVCSCEVWVDDSSLG